MSKPLLTEPAGGERAAPNGAIGLEPADEKRFRELADQWHRETDHHSSFSAKLDHSAYRMIIAMGKPLVPLILQDLKVRGGWWFKALRLITSENPVPDGAGYAECQKAWLTWGKEKGLID